MMERLFRTAAHEVGSRVEGAVNGIAHRSDDFERGYEYAASKAHEALDAAAKALEVNSDRALKQVQAHPLPIIAAVAIAGFLAGYLASSAARGTQR